MRRVLTLTAAAALLALPISAHAQGQVYPRPSPSAHVRGSHTPGSTYLPSKRYPRHNPTVKHYHHAKPVHSTGQRYPRPSPSAPQ